MRIPSLVSIAATLAACGPDSASDFATPALIAECSNGAWCSTLVAAPPDGTLWNVSGCEGSSSGWSQRAAIDDATLLGWQQRAAALIAIEVSDPCGRDENPDPSVPQYPDPYRPIASMRMYTAELGDRPPTGVEQCAPERDAELIELVDEVFLAALGRDCTHSY